MVKMSMVKIIDVPNLLTVLDVRKYLLLIGQVSDFGCLVTSLSL